MSWEPRGEMSPIWRRAVWNRAVRAVWEEQKALSKGSGELLYSISAVCGKSMKGSSRKQVGLSFLISKGIRNNTVICT